MLLVSFFIPVFSRLHKQGRSRSADPQAAASLGAFDERGAEMGYYRKDKTFCCECPVGKPLFTKLRTGNGASNVGKGPH
jgi:hypothetical protein